MSAAEKFPSYPYLGVARRLGVDYGRVLQIAEAIERDGHIGGLTQYNSALVGAVCNAYNNEQRRREIVLAQAGSARGK